MRRAARRSGFTVVELMIAIVIVGIVAATTTPRLFSDRAFVERGYYEELVAALRYAQRLAIASGCGVQLEVTAAGYVARRAQAGSGCAGADADRAARDEVPVFGGRSPAGIETSPHLTVAFDSHGRADVVRDRVIRVGSFALTVQAETGAVLAQ